MDIQDLVGFTLESCRFSKSSYTFELCGQLHNEYKTFLVSTSYSFSLPGEELAASDTFSLKVWSFLERKIISIKVDDDEQLPKITFVFEGDSQFSICSDEQLIDNLLMITDQETGDWFPVS